MKTRTANHLSFVVALFLLCGCVSHIDSMAKNPAAVIIEDTGVGLEISGTTPDGRLGGKVVLGYTNRRFMRVNPIQRSLEIITGAQVAGELNSAEVGNVVIIRIGYANEKEVPIKTRVEDATEPIVLIPIEEPLPEPITEIPVEEEPISGTHVYIPDRPIEDYQ